MQASAFLVGSANELPLGTVATRKGTAVVTLQTLSGPASLAVGRRADVEPTRTLLSVPLAIGRRETGALDR